MKNAIVYAEHRGGQTRKVTFEMASQARVLADALGGEAHAIVLGGGAATLAKALQAYALDAIHISEDAEVDAFLLDPVVDYVAQLAREVGPSLLLVANTLSGRDVAGKLVARLNAGLAADVTEFKVSGATVECVSPKMGGALTTVCAIKPADYGVATIRPNAFAATVNASQAAISQLAKPAGKTYAAAVEQDVEEGSGELALEEAPVVIAGGRGLGGAEPFETLLKPLAQVLGGAVGASRAAADAGWVPYNLQIGQTGKTVTPTLYVAVGISGAIQHKVGMRSAGTIVSINKDAGAAIGDFSDLMVVGDAFQIVPELTQMLEAAKA